MNVRLCKKSTPNGRGKCKRPFGHLNFCYSGSYQGMFILLDEIDDLVGDDKEAARKELRKHAHVDQH